MSILNAISTSFNQAVLACDCDYSTSDMTANGFQIQSPQPVSHEKAMKIVHWKMIGVVVCFVAGGFLFKKHPVPGIILMLVGAYLLFDVGRNWKEGKKFHDSIK